MRQRLALAAALLGDPPVLLLDEPANGLDPEGIAWLRGFLRYLAGQGRTVLVSSHVLSEVQQTVDDVVIIARGRLVRQASLEELEGAPTVVVRAPQPQRLVEVLAQAGLTVEPPGPDGVLRVSGPTPAGATPAEVGHAAFAAGVELHELRAAESDLESIFLGLVGNGASADGGPTGYVHAGSGTGSSIAGQIAGQAVAR
jgi:ABC-2 type transport system ATP-binding protein